MDSIPETPPPPECHPCETIKAGDSWPSTAEFFAFFRPYCTRTAQSFRTERSQRRKDQNGTPVEDEYEKLTLVCVHGPKQETRKPVGLRPIQSTFRKNCLARLKLAYHVKEARLVVSSCAFGHNHELSAVLHKHYPQTKKLTAAEKEKAVELLRIGTGARAVKDALSLDTGKALRTKDIHNVRTKMKMSATKGKTQEMILQDALRDGCKADPGLTIKFAKDFAGNLEVLALVTTKMKESFARFPEVLFMDSTYNLTSEQYPLYVLAVQDNNYYTRPVAVGFVTRDTAANIKTFLKLFKQAIEVKDLDGVRVVFVDKDFKEIRSLETEVPSARILLCWFHVLRTIKLHISGLLVDTKLKMDILRAFHACLYAQSAELFARNLYTLAKVSPAEFYQYFADNWETCREMWASYHRRELLTLGNNTTNRVEALNRSIKALFAGVQRTRMHASEAVATLLKFLLLSDATIIHHDFENLSKRTYVNNSQHRELLGMVGRYLTTSAVRLLVWQLKKYELEFQDYRLDDLGCSNWTIANIKTDNMYTLQTEQHTTMKELSESEVERVTCCCWFNSTFALPCKHIFFIRDRRSEELISLLDCLQRWFRSYTGPDVDFLKSGLCEQVADMCVRQDMDDSLEMPPRDFPALSENQRYTKALELAKELATTTSLYGGKSYEEYLTATKAFLNLVENGTPGGEIVRLLESSSTAVTETHDAREISVSSNEEKVSLDKQLCSSPPKDITDTVRLPVDESTLDTSADCPFSLPGIAVKPPGRPKGRRTTTFNSRGKHQRKRALQSPKKLSVSTAMSVKKKAQPSADDNGPEVSFSRGELSMSVSQVAAELTDTVLEIDDRREDCPKIKVSRLRLLKLDLERLKTDGMRTDCRVLDIACALIARKMDTAKYGGMFPPDYLTACQPYSRTFAAIRAQLAEGKVVVQTLYDGDNHFVTVVVYPPPLSTVIYLDSIGGIPSARIALQIGAMLWRNQGDVKVEIPSVPRQAPGSNNCAAYAIAFALDILSGLTVTNASYGKEPEIRRWLKDLVLSSILRKRMRQLSKHPHTNPQPSCILTSVGLQQERERLTSSGAIQPVAQDPHNFGCTTIDDDESSKSPQADQSSQPREPVRPPFNLEPFGDNLDVEMAEVVVDESSQPLDAVSQIKLTNQDGSETKQHHPYNSGFRTLEKFFVPASVKHARDLLVEGHADNDTWRSRGCGLLRVGDLLPVRLENLCTKDIVDLTALPANIMVSMDFQAAQRLYLDLHLDKFSNGLNIMNGCDPGFRSLMELFDDDAVEAAYENHTEWIYSESPGQYLKSYGILKDGALKPSVENLLADKIDEIVTIHAHAALYVHHTAAETLRGLFDLKVPGRGATLLKECFWCQPVKTILSLHSRDIICKGSENGLLDDAIVNAATEVLGQNFPHVGGLQPVSLFAGSTRAVREMILEVSPEEHRRLIGSEIRKVQLLNIDDNHWIAVSNFHKLETNVVYVYNSSSSSLTPASIFKIACAMRIPTNFATMKLVRPAVCRQVGGTHCGVFALMYAALVCRKEDPCRMYWSADLYAETRRFLAESLETCRLGLDPIPTKSNRAFEMRRRESCVPGTDIPLICYCRTWTSPRTTASQRLKSLRNAINQKKRTFF